MPTTINADTIVGGAVVTGDTSGVLELQSAGTTAVSISTGQVVTFTNTPVISGGATVVTTTGTQTLTNKTIAFGSNTFTGTLPVANGGTNATATPTAGAVAYGTGTAYAFTSAGTSGQVLTSAGSGAPTWATPAAGALTLLATATASSSATVLLNVTAGYDNYLVLLTGIRPDTADAVLFLRVTTSSTVRTGNYSWNAQSFQSGQATGFGTNSTGISYIPVSSTTTSFSAGMSTNSDSSLDAQINLANLASTTQYKKIFSEASYNRGSTMISCSTVAGYYGDTAAVTALTFLMNSGNIASGTFRLYGYSNS